MLFKAYSVEISQVSLFADVVRCQSIDDLKIFIQEHCANIDVMDCNSQSLIFYIVYHSWDYQLSLDVWNQIRWLIQHGADISVFKTKEDASGVHTLIGLIISKGSFQTDQLGNIPKVILQTIKRYRVDVSRVYQRDF